MPNFRPGLGGSRGQTVASRGQETLGRLPRDELSSPWAHMEWQWHGWKMGWNHHGITMSLDWFSWENLNRKPWFLPSNIWLSCKFSHHPILWPWNHRIRWRIFQSAGFFRQEGSFRLRLGGCLIWCFGSGENSDQRLESSPNNVSPSGSYYPIGDEQFDMWEITGSRIMS